ncbi:MAG: TadE/TadG family type IV pilus assembly protein [Candidatus Melainabacteria bacterium]|nr:TadE/TadG family type IV pilus assembly protein [Candidatus Melainabacteria bacterium]
MNKVRKFRRTSRNQTGAVALVIPLLLLFISIVIATFSFDYAHGLLVREELQNATDAGALAGAYELTKTVLTDTDRTNAEAYARKVMEKNRADNASVAVASGTTVTVTINSSATPRTVTVTVTKTVGNVFARLIGASTMPVSSTSTASVLKAIKKVKPNQLYPIALSLDTKPRSGPQDGEALSDLIGGNRKKTFTIVLNPQKEKNAAWLSDWVGTQNPEISIGQTTVDLSNGVQANLVKNLSPGDTLNVPLFSGDPPYNKSEVVVGVIGFRITRINFPQEIEGVILDPFVIEGTPGMPPISGLGKNEMQFLDENSPWQVVLTN